MKVPVAHLLQGSSIQANIEARYFFGEPVAGAKVKYVVHTSTHYWWDEDSEDQSSDEAEAASDESDESDNTWAETEQQEHEGVLDANGRLTVTLPTAIDAKHEDQDYRIEARVTDAANREVSGHTTVLGTYGSFRVSVEPTSYVFQSGQPVRVKVTAQDYDGKPVETQVHVGAALQKWDSVTHERSETSVTNKDAAIGANGTALVDLADGCERQRGFRGDRECEDSGESDCSRANVGLGLEWRGRVVPAERSSADCCRQEELHGGRHGASASGDGAEGIVGSGDGRG